MIPIRTYAQTLTQYLRPQAGRAALLALLLLGATGLQVLVPLILRDFIDTALAGGALSLLVWAAALYLTASVANQVLSAAATYVGAAVGWTATNLMRADLAHHLLELDMSFHTARTPGEMIERIDGDVTAVSNFFSRFVVRVAGSLLLLLGILVVLTFENLLVGSILTAYTLISIIGLGRARNIAVAASEEEREASARHFGFIEERLAGIDDIRANGAGPYVMRRFAEESRGYFFTSRGAWMRRSLLWMLTFTTFNFGVVMALALAVYLFQQGSISVGTAYLFFQYMMLLQGPIEQITDQLQELQKASAGIVRIGELLRLEPDIPRTGTDRLPSGPLSVEFDGVSFAYEDRGVLHDVTFRLEAGEVLGLLGRTGGGKTTLTRLLFRLYDPQQGAVRVGGMDLRSVDPHSAKTAIGMVTQEVQLFAATLRHNLSFFDPAVSEADLWAVLDELDLREWVESLPDGLDTRLGAGGAGLSAGQAQLVAFARVFLRNPGLVVLDEPSSRLDPATEGLLTESMTRLLAGRTGVIVAHRLETVQRADRILIVDRGRVVEYGDRVALVADPDSHFSRLLAAGAVELAEEMA